MLVVQGVGQEDLVVVWESQLARQLASRHQCRRQRFQLGWVLGQELEQGLMEQRVQV